MHAKIVLMCASICAAPLPLQAEVVSARPEGFTVRHEVSVPAAPEAAWALLVQPGKWWNSEHSWSGDAANMELDPVLGGCFCERWTTAAGDPAGAAHLTVTYVNPGEALRFSGGLGPLMGMGVHGAMVWTVEPSGEGSKIVFTYSVGGFMEPPGEDFGPIVDGVIGEQIGRLADRLTPAGQP